MSQEDILREIQNDSERWHAEEEKQQCLDQVKGILLRPRSGPNAPTDEELLRLIFDLFGIYLEIPFSRDYDPLIERLSFTASKLESVDAVELKRAWTRFVSQTEIDEWPLNMCMAQWYAEHGMVSHAISVHEHLYSLILRGEFHQDCPDEFETWLIDLLDLCRRRKLPGRAKHLCEVIEDYYNNGYVSLDGYAETLSVLPELIHAGIKQQIHSDRCATRNRLEHEYGPVLDRLHGPTRKLVVEAELWSSNHWINIDPSAAPPTLGTGNRVRISR
jgi:hypothetical protein